MQTTTRMRAPAPEPAPARRRPNRWRRGWVLAVLAVLTGLVLLLHDYLPNSVGNLGSLLDTFLPWVGVVIPLLGIGALVRRSASAGVALLLPVLVWVWMFGSVVLPGKGGGAHNLRVLTHNVDADNRNHPATAAAVLAAGADVVALEEMTSTAMTAYERALKQRYPYHVKRSTVGLWSRYPIHDSGSVDIGLSWTRALRAEVATPEGDVAFYVAHLVSVRIGSSGFTSDQRDQTIQLLGKHLTDEKLDQVVLMGDLNGTASDRSLAPVMTQLRSAQGVAGDGFGFSWPAGFPMARIDHVLVRGIEPTRAWVLPRTGSDHRPVAADLRL
jgi:vancomycin resistance protein VanJ